jgi:4-phosphopantoate--beta-alanine ligase
MTRIARSHPRYRSLVTRAHLAEAARRGVVVPEGLIAHGRGEAFDYLLGERSTDSSLKAARIAAGWLSRAHHPVLSVNGNVAALAANEVAALARALPSLRVEVNLFHRTPARSRLIARRLRAAGVRPVLGVRPTRRIPGLPSDRAWVDEAGILLADVCLIPLEDGDRTEALQRLGKRVIAIDLNPLSRTAQRADLTIVDEVTRALRNIREEIESGRSVRRGSKRDPPNAQFLRDALRAMQDELTRRSAGPTPTPSRRGRAGARPR